MSSWVAVYKNPLEKKTSIKDNPRLLAHGDCGIMRARRIKSPC